MLRSWIAFPFVLPLASLLAGCGNPCEGAQNRIIKRYEECGVTIAEPPEDEKPAEVVCVEADATYLNCLADCVDAASCEGIKGENSEEAVDFGKCNGDCKNG